MEIGENMTIKKTEEVYTIGGSGSNKKIILKFSSPGNKVEKIIIENGERKEISFEDFKHINEVLEKKDHGKNEESGGLEIEFIESGKKVETILHKIRDIFNKYREEYDNRIPKEVIIEELESQGFSKEKIEKELEKMRRRGQIYSSKKDHYSWN